MERIGRYTIEREIGRGNMAIVFEAIDPRIDRRVAIKVLRESLARDVTARQRFVKEARAAGSLTHPEIVTVFDVGQADGLPFIAMEYLPGRTLANHVAAGREFTTAEIVELGIDLTEALDYAHWNGVIHRDIKPANISYDTKTGQIRLMDFGIAAIQHSPSRAAEQDAILGTPAYMAPEQIAGEEPDERADLYSLGATLNLLVTGQPPFPDQDLDVLIQRVISEPAARPEPRSPQTPRELIELIMRLLAKRPGDRPSSARLVAEELKEIRATLNRDRSAWTHGVSAWRGPVLIGALVAAVSGIGLGYAYKEQSAAMAEATFAYGDALTGVLARETAEPLILEDSAALGMLINDFSVNPGVHFLHVADRDGFVLASTDPFLQGEPRPELSGQPVERTGNIRLLRLENQNLSFQAPINFQARRVGSVELGLDGRPLKAAQRATLGMLMTVFALILLVVAAGLSWLVRRQNRSMKRISWGLNQIGRGQYDFRLESGRPDEFSPLRRQFNKMAIRLQERYMEPRTEPEPAAHQPDEETPAGRADQTLDLSVETISRKASSE